MAKSLLDEDPGIILRLLTKYPFFGNEDDDLLLLFEFFSTLKQHGDMDKLLQSEIKILTKFCSPFKVKSQTTVNIAAQKRILGNDLHIYARITS